MTTTNRPVRRWPLVLIAAPAAVAVWSGWVGLGTLCGFGIVHPLPGIAGGFRLNTAITLPVGVEAYGAYALGAWLTPGTAVAARRFARRSALGSLLLGMAGQVIYHLLAAAHAHRAPWPVVVLVACLPVVTLGFGAGLTHLLRAGHGPAAGAGDAPAADTVADASAGAIADTGPASPAAAVADSTPDTDPDSTPDTRPDIAPDTGPDSRRSPRRSPARTGTAAAVARLRARHPDMPAADIARRLGVSDRTVRRHLAARPEPADSAAA